MDGLKKSKRIIMEKQDLKKFLDGIREIATAASNLEKAIEHQADKTDDFYHSIKHIQSIKTECKSALSRDYDCER